MKVRIIKGYNDTILRRVVVKGEEIDVSDSRAQALISKAVAEPVADRIAELETLLAERDARIAELEKKTK